jgi:drug/metabolite transporter (DMT)-like permease
VPPSVLALVLVAAVIHVTWNVLLKTAGDPLDSATIGIGAATALVVPVAAVAWWSLGRPLVSPQMAGLAILSGIVETAFFVLLSAAYRRGDLSVVYPTARGTAPLVAVVIGVVVLGERLGVAGALGVAALVAGLLMLQRPWRLLSGGDPAARSASLFAVATGVAIACYSAIDRVGVRLEDGWLYAVLIWPAMAVGLAVVWVARRRWAVAGRSGPAPEAMPRREVGRAALGGLLIMAAYSLILVAYTLAPLAVVSPLRESAIVLASAWGIIGLGEAADRADAVRRLAAAAVVVVGIALLVVGG